MPKITITTTVNVTDRHGQRDELLEVTETIKVESANPRFVAQVTGLAAADITERIGGVLEQRFGKAPE